MCKEMDLRSVIFILFMVSSAISKKIVSHLNETSFFQQLRSRDMVLVSFYAPWCYFSKKISPELDAAASAFNGTHTRVSLSKFNCERAITFCQVFGVRTYPSLYLFMKGAWLDIYKGKHKAKNIIKYLEENMHAYNFVNSS